MDENHNASDNQQGPLDDISWRDRLLLGSQRASSLRAGEMDVVDVDWTSAEFGSTDHHVVVNDQDQDFASPIIEDLEAVVLWHDSIDNLYEEGEDGDENDCYDDENNVSDLFVDEFPRVPASISTLNMMHHGHTRSQCSSYDDSHDDHHTISSSSRYSSTTSSTSVRTAVRFADDTHDSKLLTDEHTIAGQGMMALSSPNVMDIYGQESTSSRSKLYDDLDDDECSFIEDDEEAQDEAAHEQEIIKGILYSAGGAAVFAGIGFVAKRVLSVFRKDDENLEAGMDVVNGTDQAGSGAQATSDATHVAIEAGVEVKVNATAGTAAKDAGGTTVGSGNGTGGNPNSAP